jgi:hypothetical protein
MATFENARRLVNRGRLHKTVTLSMDTDMAANISVPFVPGFITHGCVLMFLAAI